MLRTSSCKSSLWMGCGRLSKDFICRIDGDDPGSAVVSKLIDYNLKSRANDQTLAPDAL